MASRSARLDPAHPAQPRHRQHRQGAAQCTRQRRVPERHLHPAPADPRTRQRPHPVRGEQPRPHHAVRQSLRRQGWQPAADRRRPRQRAAVAARLHSGVVRLGSGRAARQWRAWTGRTGRNRITAHRSCGASARSSSPARAAASWSSFRLSYEAASLDPTRGAPDRATDADRAAAARLRRGDSSMRARCGCCRRHAAGARLDLRTRLPGDEAARAGHRLRGDARHRQPSAQQRGGARSARAAGRLMRWPSASRRPGAICAITSRRASTATRTGARVRRRVHPCRRHRPGIPQHRVRPAGAHPHLA